MQAENVEIDTQFMQKCAPGLGKRTELVVSFRACKKIESGPMCSVYPGARFSLAEMLILVSTAGAECTSNQY